MIVDYTPEALANLDEIWIHNAQHFGMNHAASYVDFLRTRTDRLSADFALGRPVPTNPRFLYRVIQKRTKRHGHIVVYEVTETELIRILRYFHTAQDWQKALD